MTDTKPIIDTALRSAEPHELTEDIRSIVVPAEGHLELVDLEDFAPHPRRKKGTAHAHDAEALVAYVRKHGDDDTEVWADLDQARIVAVLNAHTEGLTGVAGWQDHRVLYGVRKTDAWKAWTALDGRWLDQAQFAEHIEDRSLDIANPSAADMLELAQSFHATIGGTFESSKRLSSGETQLVFKEEINAKAGQRGQLEIPSHIDLALVPFQGAPAYKVKARFRYRIVGGHLKLSYALERPDDVLREAFAAVVTLVADGIDQPVHNGWPE